MQIRHFLLAASLIGLAVAANAQPVEGFYIGGGAGVDFLQNEPVELSVPSAKRAYTFDPGFTGQVSLGYGLGNGLRLEVEGDYANNHVRHVKYFEPVRAGGHEQQYGAFVNAVYDVDLGLPVTPYLGVGVGYQRVELDAVNFSLPQVSVHPGGSESRAAFAYQVIAGASYALDDVALGLALTAEYRMIGVDDPSGYARNANGGNVRATFENVFNHEILLGLRYGFGALEPAAVTPLPPVPAVVRSRTYLVFFDWDRADQTVRARQVVVEAADAAIHTGVTRIEVDGHTALSGTAAYNQALSVRRGQAVAAELVRDGVRREEISIQGYGETHPLIPTAAARAREPQNRRVEIVLH